MSNENIAEEDEIRKDFMQEHHSKIAFADTTEDICIGDGLQVVTG